MRLPKSKLTLWLFMVLALGLALAVGGCDCGDDDDDDDDIPIDDDDDDDDDDDTPSDDDDDDTTDDDDDDDDDTPSPADPLCEEGRAMLRAGSGPLAAIKFREGLALDENAEQCRYGLVLADTLHQFDTVSVIVAYIEMFLEGYQPPEAVAADDDWPETGASFLDELLNRMLDGLLFDASDEAIENVQWVRTNAPDMIFPLDRMPIIFNFEEVADAHGDFDLPDAVAAESWAGLLPGALQHLTALNLDFDIGLVFEVIDINFGGDLIEVIATLVDYMLRLFDNPLYPDFFTLKDDGQAFVDAGLKLGLGCRHGQEVFALLVAEQGGQENEVLGYADLNGNGVWDAGEPLVVPPWGELDAAQMEAADAVRVVLGQLADSFLDYGEYDLTPGVPEPFRLAYLNPLLRAFGIPGLIPDMDALVIDFGAAYQDVDPTALRDTIVTILHIAELLLPG